MRLSCSLHLGHKVENIFPPCLGDCSPSHPGSSLPGSDGHQSQLASILSNLEERANHSTKFLSPFPFSLGLTLVIGCWWGEDEQHKISDLKLFWYFCKGGRKRGQADWWGAGQRDCLSPLGSLLQGNGQHKSQVTSAIGHGPCGSTAIFPRAPCTCCDHSHSRGALILDTLPSLQISLYAENWVISCLISLPTS